MYRLAYGADSPWEQSINDPSLIVVTVGDNPVMHNPMHSARAFCQLVCSRDCRDPAGICYPKGNRLYTFSKNALEVEGIASPHLRRNARRRCGPPGLAGARVVLRDSTRVSSRCWR